MIRKTTIIALFCTLASLAVEPPAMERVKPLEPAEAIKSFVVRPGFKVELVAAEPLIASPVAMDWDENGNLFVCEYPEYNQYANPNFKDKGRVRRLTSSKGDGIYDASTVFADNLPTPCGIICANGGVYVGAPPDLWFLKDTKNAGVADVKRKVLTGFGRDPAGEGMLNSFRWTLEGKVLMSTGHAGGDLKKVDDPNAKPQAIRRQNILFDPRKETFEFTSGGGQHGLAVSDWGDQFVCDNAHPIQHVLYDQREIRNPYVEAPPVLENIHPFGSKFKIGRISPPEPWRVLRTQMRSKKEFYGSDEGGQPFGFFTGATGVTIYRGDAWPAEFKCDIFVGDVANNLTYRAKLTRDGLHWKAKRAEEGPEFLASKDIWHRPVQYANGPDGCLYVIDMYRELIECASCIPGDVLKGVDVSGGINRGRIYRIVPDGAKLRTLPKLGAATTKELVALLEHPNAWHRETAMRLLLEQNDKTAIALLKTLNLSSNNALSRTTSRCILAGLGGWTKDEALNALGDQDENALIYAMRLSAQSDIDVNRNITFLERHDNIRIRRQASASRKPLSDAETLRDTLILVKRDINEPLMRFSVLGNSKNAAHILLLLLSDADIRANSQGKAMLADLVSQIGASGNEEEIRLVVNHFDNNESDNDIKVLLIPKMILRMQAKNRPMLGDGLTARVLNVSIEQCQRTALDAKQSLKLRAASIRALKIATWQEAGTTLAACLDIRQPSAVQIAALETLGGFDAPEVSALIVKAWPSLTPPVRATALESLLSRKTGTSSLLDAVEKNAIRPADIDPARVQILLSTLDEPLKSRAMKLLGAQALSPRKDVLEKYKPSLDMKGDVAKGKLVFKNVCSNCHKLDGVGQDIGPDLSTARVRGAESILLSVLDPNREVLPKYYTYKATTDSGTTVTGLITADTATSVTIRRADNTTATIARANLEDLRSTGLSAMPEGLEQQVDQQAMADLLAYLMAAK